jgi:hypothetical protein
MLIAGEEAKAAILLEAGTRQRLDRSDDIDGTVCFVNDILDEQRWKCGVPLALAGHREIAATLAVLRIDAKADVQLLEGFDHSVTVARLGSPVRERL